jgi:hypothetical protein
LDDKTSVVRGRGDPRVAKSRNKSDLT